jgi:hypothetical protein
LPWWQGIFQQSHGDKVVFLHCHGDKVFDLFETGCR